MPKIRERKKIIILIIILVLLLGGALVWRIWWWQGKLAEVRNLISQIFGQKQLPDNIKAALEKIKTDPTNVDSYITVASYDRDQGKYDEAIKIYLAALQIRPTDTLLLMNLADLYERTKNWTEAEKAYLKVIDTNPKWVNAYRNLAELYRYNLTAKQSEIPKILLLGLNNNKDLGIDAEFVGQLAVYYQDFGPKKEAIKWYEKLVELSPNNTAARTQLEQLKKSN